MRKSLMFLALAAALPMRGICSMTATDPLLDTSGGPAPAPKPAAKKAAAAKPAAKKTEPKAAKEPKAKKANGGWAKPGNYDQIKKDVLTAVKRKKGTAVETATLAKEMKLDAKHVRWACRDLAKDKQLKLKMNARKRAEVTAVPA